VTELFIYALAYLSYFLLDGSADFLVVGAVIVVGMVVVDVVVFGIGYCLENKIISNLKAVWIGLYQNVDLKKNNLEL